VVPSILAIDDSPTVRKLIELFLREAGYDVRLADRGQIAQKLAREMKPDLILLDYILPDKPSPAICQELAADPATSEIPIVMISTNGGAIRQLYAESQNVKDYLTKPFQARVLQAVVQNVLRGGGPLKPETTSATPTRPPVPANVPATTTPRIQPKLRPRETQAPFVAKAQPVVPVARTVVAPASSGVPLTGGAADAQSSDIQRELRALLNARFRGLAKKIPEWEQRRGDQSAETYYLPLLLRKELLAEIGAETERAQWASDRTPLIAGTSDWMGIDATLFHLGRAAATGVFSLRMPDETVEVRLVAGQVVAVHSNDPRRYCAGAAYQFRSLPTPVIAAAVAAQQRDGTPFFLTVHRMGKLGDPGMLADLLRAQGVKAVLRAFTTPGVRYAFVARELAAESRRFSIDRTVPAFVFEVLRGIDDWLEIETKTGSGDTVFALVPEAEGVLPTLGMTTIEEVLVDRLDGQVSLQVAADAVGLGLYEACALIYRLVKLNLVRIVAVVMPLADEAGVEAFLRAADGSVDLGAQPEAPAES
jgi:CheY-like chemotaxis protein